MPIARFNREPLEAFRRAIADISGSTLRTGLLTARLTEQRRLAEQDKLDRQQTQTVVNEFLTAVQPKKKQETFFGAERARTMEVLDIPKPEEYNRKLDTAISRLIGIGSDRATTAARVLDTLRQTTPKETEVGSFYEAVQRYGIEKAKEIETARVQAGEQARVKFAKPEKEKTSLDELQRIERDINTIEEGMLLKYGQDIFDKRINLDDVLRTGKAPYITEDGEVFSYDEVQGDPVLRQEAKAIPEIEEWVGLVRKYDETAKLLGKPAIRGTVQKRVKEKTTLPATPQPKPSPKAEKQIRVRHKASGRVGKIPESKFDSNLFDRL